MPHNDGENGSVMQGGGFYNGNSAMQAAGISAALSLWQEACRSVVVGDGPLVIVDYGSSEGRNSIAPIRAAIDTVRATYGNEKPVEIFHTDLPSNDFSSLFKTIYEDPGGYMATRHSIYPAAIGRTFYEQLLPAGSVHLGWSTWSMQWMSRGPARAPDHILAGMSKRADVIAAVDAQQRSDWRRLLELRSVELTPGGKLLIGFTGRTSEETGWEWLLGELWAALEDMGRRGLFSEDELDQITIPIGLRTIAQIQEPFGIAGTFAALRLEHCELLKVPDPHWDEFVRTGNAHYLATRQAETLRAWSAPAIASLINPARDREALMSELFTRFVYRIEAAPRQHEPYMAVVVLSKERP